MAIGRRSTKGGAKPILQSVAMYGYDTANSKWAEFKISSAGGLSADITSWGGTALTGRDISLDFAAMAAIPDLFKRLSAKGAIVGATDRVVLDTGQYGGGAANVVMQCTADAILRVQVSNDQIDWYTIAAKTIGAAGGAENHCWLNSFRYIAVAGDGTHVPGASVAVVLASGRA